MRSTDKTSGSLFGYVGLEAHIPDRRPLRVNRSHDSLSPLDNHLFSNGSRT